MKFMNGIDLNSQKITNLADPSSATDAVNLQYMQAFVKGLQFKQSVRVASTTAITIASPGASIDGVTMSVGDRVLEKDNGTASARGIYVWNGAAVPMTRATDADGGTELSPGTAVYVVEGTTNGDKLFTITSDAAITIGTTAQTWTQFGGGNTYTAGNGISISSNVVSAVAGTGISVGGGGIAIDTSIVARKVSSTIGNGSSTSIAVTHSFGTKDVIWALRQVSDDAYVIPDAVSTDTNTITFTFATAPSSNSLRATIIG